MTIKIIVMGVGGVGKSAITNRFVAGRWIDKYDPTVEESYQTTIDIDGKALQVEILDTAGQDAYTPLRETFMHTGDGFLLVYSITDDQTLEDLRGIREQILRVHRDHKVPMVVVGNKLDAASERAISVQEGEALAEEFHASFLEVSARTKYRVKEAFDMIVRKVLAKSPKAGSNDSSTGSVFGAGKIDNSMDPEKVDSKTNSNNKKKSDRKNSNDSKKSKCYIL